MSPVQRRALAAMAKQGLGTVRTRMGVAARAVLEALADSVLSSITNTANEEAQ